MEGSWVHVCASSDPYCLIVLFVCLLLLFRFSKDVPMGVRLTHFCAAYSHVTWSIYVIDSYLWHDSFVCVIRTCDMTHWHVWYASFVCMTWLVAVWHDSFICVIHMCDMTYSYVWHDVFICVIRPIHTCDVTHLYLIWLIHMCDMTNSYM